MKPIKYGVFYCRLCLAGAIKCIAFWCLLIICQPVQAQQVIDKVKFFKDEYPLTVSLNTDIGELLRTKSKGEYQKAAFSVKLPDSTLVTQEIRVSARGKFRRNYCYVPPLSLNFRNATPTVLYPLNTLKLVCGCQLNPKSEQLLLKEYLIYKIYNLLSPKSFLARLVRITYNDSKGKKKPFSQFAFFLENVDAMAKRNGCKEYKTTLGNYELLDRDETTLMTVFQYMIGNTDWGLANRPESHNLKIIYSRKDSAARPFAVPYDFDQSGLVNAGYAAPSEKLEIESVSERLYRGFPRSANELQSVFQLFNNQKDNIYSIINDFEPLDARSKKDIILYLDQFYKTINKRREVETIFINGARQY